MNANVSHLGAINGAAATREELNALFLKIYSGEVLTAFNGAQVTMGRHQVRTIPHGE